MSKSVNPFRKTNVFSLLMVVLTFAVVLRLFDIGHFAAVRSAAQSTPPAQSFAPVADSGAQPPPPPPPAPSNTGQLPPTSPYGEHAYTAAEVDVLQSLAKRRDELDRRAQEIDRREALLKAAEEEVDRKVAELGKIKGELENLLNKQQSIQNDRINSLVKIYETMNPKDAARIFDTLEMDVLMEVISKMNVRKSAPVLAAMDPEKARLVTLKLSEQHQLPKLPDDVKTPAASAPATPAAPVQASPHP